MCLLVIQSEKAPLLPFAWLENFYQSNQDGVGVMYADGGNLIVKKILPKNTQEFAQFYESEIAGRFCAFHLRMKTHGDINLANCHPYEILNQQEHGIDLWLMHNGILATGNSLDKTKSDTWHYIANYLKPMLGKNPDFAFTNAFKKLIENHIGQSNKFVLMDNNGRHQVINEHQGVNWGGLWLSNTYAWTAPMDAIRVKQATGKKESKLIKQWQTQVNTAPVKRSSMTWYDRGYQSSSHAFDAPDFELVGEDEEYDILAYIEEELFSLTEWGYAQAGEVHFELAYDFVYEMGLDCFFELTQYLRDGNILEQEFLAVMESPHKVGRYLKVVQDQAMEDY